LLKKKKHLSTGQADSLARSQNWKKRSLGARNVGAIRKRRNNTLICEKYGIDEKKGTGQRGGGLGSEGKGRGGREGQGGGEEKVGVGREGGGGGGRSGGEGGEGRGRGRKNGGGGEGRGG